MKVNTHPSWFPDALVSCACGNTFKIGSTKSELRVDICNKCHPFFSGSMRYADREGKVDKFQKKRDLARKKAPELAKLKAKKLGVVAEDKSPKSLKEMLLGLK